MIKKNKKKLITIIYSDIRKRFGKEAIELHLKTSSDITNIEIRLGDGSVIYAEAIMLKNVKSVVQVRYNISNSAYIYHLNDPQYNSILQAQAPPKPAEFIAYLLPRKYREPLLGDLEEVYPEAVEKFGLRWAKVWYWFQVMVSVLSLFGKNVLKDIIRSIMP